MNKPNYDTYGLSTAGIVIRFVLLVGLVVAIKIWMPE